jgi:hypothetical protein
MTGCVSFECQDYIDERKHSEDEAEDMFERSPIGPSPDYETPWWVPLLPLIPIITPWPDPY